MIFIREITDENVSGKKTMKSATDVSAQTRDEARSRMRELLLGLAPGPSP